MSLRNGMSYIVSQVRLNCNAGTADYTVAGTMYFTDDQIQNALDNHRAEYVQLEMLPVGKWLSGATQYYDYALPEPVGVWIEDDLTGTQFGRVYDTTGTNITSGYTADWKAGKIRFTANQYAYTRYIDVRAFNVDLASADIWRQKASLISGRIDWSSDNHSIKASQEYDHCIAMAEQFEKSVGLSSAGMYRGDQNPTQRRPAL